MADKQCSGGAHCDGLTTGALPACRRGDGKYGRALRPGLLRPGLTRPELTWTGLRARALNADAAGIGAGVTALSASGEQTSKALSASEQEVSTRSSAMHRRKASAAALQEQRLSAERPSPS